MVKKHEYLEYTFTIKVELNHKVEKRIDGIREHRIIIYNTLGAHNYCETHLAETANLQEIIFCMLEDAQKWVDKLNIGDKSQEQLILESMGFKNMKNIHTIEIPTLEIFGVMPYGKSEIQYQIECFLASLNVYITSNEYIGLSYYLDGDLVRKGVVDDKDYWEVRKDYKKIIMTTDPKLIKDGIQVIPNEFMEWFVKNPSCEEVEVKKGFADGSNYGYNFLDYKIIIPKEEPKQGTMSEAIKQVINNQLKQETFEEAAKSHAIYELENNYKPTKESFKLACKRSFIQGAKWQQEQSNCELSELLEQRNEMLAMLEYFVENNMLSAHGDELAEQLIKKVKDNE